MSGKVWLIGAGPGDAELVDDLVGRDILDFARPGTRIVPVGKRGGCKSTPQAFILRLMARYARQGRQVARLKGGDPFIFGRGGEEWAWLAERGVAVEAVNGITAAFAAGADLGLPLTHRSVARGVALVTAHTQDGSQPDWTALANSRLTVVCYMGMAGLPQLVPQLLAAGFAAKLPVAVVHRAGCREQQHLVTTLQHLQADVAASGLASPAVIILGEVVEHAMHVALDAAARHAVA